MATIRWCPIFPKWDSYQPLAFTHAGQSLGNNTVKRLEPKAGIVLAFLFYRKDVFWVVQGTALLGQELSGLHHGACGRHFVLWWPYLLATDFCSSLQRFTKSAIQNSRIGSEISFLKRKICRTERSLALLPGYKCWKGGWALWAVLGKTRPQTIPCDSSIQVEDRSAFTVKELSGAMSRPTCTALQRLKKMVGYLKSTPDYCVLLEIQLWVKGDGIQLTILAAWKFQWQWLELKSDAQEIYKLRVHMLNGSFLLPAQGLSA